MRYAFRGNVKLNSVPAPPKPVPKFQAGDIVRVVYTPHRCSGKTYELASGLTLFEYEGPFGPPRKRYGYKLVGEKLYKPSQGSIQLVRRGKSANYAAFVKRMNEFDNGLSKGATA